jgi:hypothetical protein
MVSVRGAVGSVKGGNIVCETACNIPQNDLAPLLVIYVEGHKDKHVFLFASTCLVLH